MPSTSSLLRRIVLFASAIVLVLGATVARADVLTDFNCRQDYPGLYISGGTCVVGDYVFVSRSVFNQADPASSYMEVQIYRIDNAFFSLASLDVYEVLPPSWYTRPLEFTGWRTNDYTFEQVAFDTVDGATQFSLPQHVTLGSSFSHVSLVQIRNPWVLEPRSGFPFNGFFAIDNLALTPVTAVPEASTWSMMALSLLLGGFVARRRVASANA